MQKIAYFPLLRLLVPFCVGILFYVSGLKVVWFSEFWYNLILLVSIVVVLIVLLMVQLFFNIKIIVSFVIDIGLVVFGYFLSYYQDSVHHPDFIGNKTDVHKPLYMIVKPLDIVVHKAEYNRVVFNVYQIFNSDKNKWENVRGKIMIRITPIIPVDSIYHPNAYYLLNTQLQEVSEPGNPYVFNYAEYLKRHGIYHTGSLKRKDEMKFLSIQKRWGINELALYTKYRLFQYFKSNKFLDKSSQQIAIAFLTGFDDEIENDIVQSFVYAGTIHILSVSGFHTGLIFLLLTFIFSLVDPYKRYRWIRAITIISVLFFYAFMCGFFPPIVRASIMLSLLVIRQYFYTDRILHPLNVLSAAAFFILVMNPLYINDMGFLLSFSAMVGLIYFSPRYNFNSRILQSIWDLVSISIGAQLGTLPIALYYFHSFSSLFILANLLIIPLASVILILCILSLIPISYISIILNYLIQILIHLSNSNYFSRTYFNWVHFTLVDSIFLTSLIISFYAVMKKIQQQEWHWVVGINVLVFILSIWVIVHHLLFIQSYRKIKMCLYAERDRSTLWIQYHNTLIFNSIHPDNFDANNGWQRNMLLKECLVAFKYHPFNFIKLKEKKVIICNQIQDTILIKRIKPNFIIWNVRGIPYLNAKYNQGERIYWITQQKTHASLPPFIIPVRTKEYIEISL